MISISAAAGLLALSSAEFFEFSDLEVATDRWFYPFNATPGDRILASTFGQDIYTVFDDRDGQFLLTFDLTELGIATPIDPNQITFEALRLEVNYEGTNPVVYDNTFDNPSTFGSTGTPDVDAGRPLELWAVGWRDPKSLKMYMRASLPHVRLEDLITRSCSRQGNGVRRKQALVDEQLTTLSAH